MLVQGLRSVRYQGAHIELVDVTWTEGSCTETRRWWIGPSQALVETFAVEVAEISNEIVDEVLVFAFGSWERDPELRASIRTTRFDSLVLPSGTADRMLRDFQDFLGAREEFARYGVPWKRGALLMGPPGNGKTHCVKALINALDLPCLYVRSLESPYIPASRCVRMVFERARRSSPCLLVMEDLDSLVTDKTRSVFLNELDGFASNDGIITLATANHPERLDPALLDRPSRFDRKYVFELPKLEERRRYLEWWKGRLAKETPLSLEVVEAAAQATEGFSYAYLKELVFSSLVGWMSENRRRNLQEVLQQQIPALRAQMSRDAERPPEKPEGFDEAEMMEHRDRHFEP